MKKCLLLSLLLSLGCLVAFGQTVLSTEVCIGFRLDKSFIDPKFGDNAARLSDMISLFEKVEKDSTVELTGVVFSGSASPEGRLSYNNKLAAARMAALEKYVRQRVDIPDSLITRKPGGIAWKLLSDIVAASDMPYKEEALRVLRDVPERICDSRGRIIDSRRKQLMELQQGRTWRYMSAHFFNRLRNAAVVTLTVKHIPAEPVEEAVAHTDTVQLAPPEPAENHAETVAPVADTAAVAVSRPEPRPFYMSIKTNMLYDLAALPNVGVEFYLGKNWSISANWMYGWWKAERRHRYWRAYGGDVAVRYWIGKAAHIKPLTGHHIGLYGQILTYDFEFGGKGQMAGEPGKPLWSSPSYAVGLEYGYSLPIASQFNIDFAIGLGYLAGKYYEYKPVDSHYVWEATKQRHWFGPTKIEVSLVWLLGKGNCNERKDSVK